MASSNVGCKLNDPQSQGKVRSHRESAGRGTQRDRGRGACSGSCVNQPGLDERHSGRQARYGV